MQLENFRDVNFIVLSGEPKAGKTTTLNELIISLIDKNKNDVEKIEVFKKTFKNFNNFDDNKKLELKLYLESIKGKKQKKNKEFDHIYSFEYNEKHILVITEGDDKLKLLGTLFYAFFILDLKINVVVCATREKFYNDFKEDLSKIGSNIADEDKLEKKKSSEKAKQESDNQKISEEILKKINNLMKKSGNIKI